VERGRTEFHQAVRRLYASGASMRDIAEALGMSHQRVHQIVNGDGEMATPTRRHGVLSRLVRRSRKDCESGRKGSRPAGLVLDRLSVDAREAMSLAAEEAWGLHHNYLGTEHVLLGLLRIEHGLAVRLLPAVGADLERSRAAIRHLLGVAPPTFDTNLRPTGRTKRVLELARQEAKSLRSTHVRSEHLLLGLARESGGLGARILADLGVGYEHLRARVGRAALACSFCGRSGLDVAHLVAGPSVYICEHCTQAADRLDGRGSDQQPEAPLSLVPRDQPAACSFCGKQQADVERLITAGSAAMICEGCLGLCREIQDEERQAFIPGQG